MPIPKCQLDHCSSWTQFETMDNNGHRASMSPRAPIPSELDCRLHSWPGLPAAGHLQASSYLHVSTQVPAPYPHPGISTHPKAWVNGYTERALRSLWTFARFAVPIALSRGSTPSVRVNNNSLDGLAQRLPFDHPLKGNDTRRDSTSTNPAWVIQFCTRNGALGSLYG